jgi:hypothetical protein
VRRLLVLTATEMEAHAVARHLRLPWLGGALPRFGQGRVEVACVGLRAIRLDGLAVTEPPALVVSAGLCGALDPSLAAGALVVPATVTTAGGDAWPTAPAPPVARQGTLLSVDQVVETAAAKSRLWLETAALAVDMESAAILRWAGAQGLPAAVVRAVSDPAGRGVPADLAGAVAADGRLRPMGAIGAVLARPSAAADAVALRAGTRAALPVVAAALARVLRALTA